MHNESSVLCDETSVQDLVVLTAHLICLQISTRTSSAMASFVSSVRIEAKSEHCPTDASVTRMLFALSTTQENHSTQIEVGTDFKTADTKLVSFRQSSFSSLASTASATCVQGSSPPFGLPLLLPMSGASSTHSERIANCPSWQLLPPF